MSHPYDNIRRQLRGHDYFDFTALGDKRLERLPTSVRVLLEGAVRNCDGFLATPADVEKIMDWATTRGAVEVPFFPARVLLQDYTGVPCIVDLAAMRDAIASVGGDPSKINPQIPVELVVDHSVQVDATRSEDAREQNEAKEFERNSERFKFLKWGAKAFDKLKIVPPGNGIVHQVNLEYLARVAFDETLLYPDSVVGTDSHTTMINGLGVLGWGVGGIEAEAAMLGQPISMLLPHVVGFHLTGEMPPGATATDVVLTITNALRKVGVVGKFVEFYGKGVQSLSLADRSTISNMAPEYGATCGLFPVDETSLAYMLQTGRDAEHVENVREYLKAVGLFADHEAESQVEYSQVVSLDLSTVLPCIAGPKRPQDLVAVKDQLTDFAACLAAAPGAKGFGVSADALSKTVPLSFAGKEYVLSHGSVVIAAITSCTNTSNPAVLIAAGLVAQRALAKGLVVAPYVKTSLSPGSQVVEAYLKACGLIEPLASQGFAIAGYGCMTCIGNSGELGPGVSEAINASGIMAGAVLSGNRNFEGRVHPDTMANYLASPPLVVAYALAGTVNIDLTTEPLGTGTDGKPVFLADLWPSRAEVDALIKQFVTPATFSQVYTRILEGNQRWDSLPVASSADGRYAWDDASTYIHQPPFFAGFSATPPAHPPVQNAHCLLLLGDSITTDHISPAGSIHKTSAAAKWLIERGVDKASFNSYGARRGNDLVMTRGTFANTRLSNRLAGAGATGPVTVHIPSGEMMSVFDAAERYKAEGTPTVVIAGKEYGSGSSRDWAAKGPQLLGVRAVIAESFERIHRSNLVGMGVLPLCFKEGESAASHGIKGNETITVHFGGEVKPGQDVQVTIGETMVTTVLRIDTDAELGYFANGGILPYVVRKLASQS